jgi:hypothetical protein
MCAAVGSPIPCTDNAKFTVVPVNVTAARPLPSGGPGGVSAPPDMMAVKVWAPAGAARTAPRTAPSARLRKFFKMGPPKFPVVGGVGDSAFLTRGRRPIGKDPLVGLSFSGRPGTARRIVILHLVF